MALFFFSQETSIGFLIFLIPIFFGIIFGKRYNIIMGVVTAVFVGYLLPFLIDFCDEAFIDSINQSTENGIASGILLLSSTYKDYFDVTIGTIVNDMSFNFDFLVQWGPFIFLTLVFLIVLVPSSKLRKLRKRKKE